MNTDTINTSAEDLTASDVVTLRADEENNAARFWSAAHRAFRNASALTAAQRSVALRLFSDGLRGVECARADAEAIVAWAKSVDGYSDGPTHAPDALVICES